MLRSAWTVVFALLALLDVWRCTPTQHENRFVWIGGFFYTACVLEACVRAVSARRLALENHALDTFEKRLQQGFRNTRSSLQFRDNQQLDEILAKATLRSYLPMILIFLLWFSLLPATNTCGDDGALATYYIRVFNSHISAGLCTIQDIASKTIWKLILPFKLYQPRRFIARISRLLSIIKYARFGFPLFRMNLKLMDQLLALHRTYRQAHIADAARHKRIGRPSLILDDLRQLEALTKVQTGLAQMNSQLFDHGNQIARHLQLHQTHGRRLQKLFRRIRRDVHQNAMDQYETIRSLTQEVKRTLHKTLFSSQHLLSPRSRFSIAWRLTVTNILLLEMVRLVVSYSMAGHVRLSISQIIRTCLVHCEHPERMRRRLAIVTNVFNDVRKQLSNIVPILVPPPLIVCVPSSTSAALFLQFGVLITHFIDLVSFLDIFIWFYTGDLDESGLIVPKPFFTRLILPGTLVQVLDHPTLPELLPSLIRNILEFAGTVGYGRAIRWALAIVPCCAMVVRPLQRYVFGHMDTSKGIMGYAESLGMFTPIRPYYDMDTSSIRSYGSQIGLSFDESTRSLDDHIQSSELPPDSYVMEGTHIVTPSTTGHLRRRRRGGILDDHETDTPMQQFDETFDEYDTYRFSFSSRNLSATY